MDLIERLQDGELYTDAVDEAIEEIGKLRDLCSQIRGVVESGILPNGDGIDVTTILWLEDLLLEYESDVSEHTGNTG